jgi:glutamyl-tRNA synthetase
VGKSGSRFDQEKANWFNHHYLVEKSNEELSDLFLLVLKSKNIDPGKKNIAFIMGLVKERVNFVSELWEQSSFFFKAPKEYDSQTVKKRWKTDSFVQMQELINILEPVTDFTSDNTENTVKTWIEQKEYGMGAIMNAFRLLIVGAAKGPHLFDIIEVIGKKETLDRMHKGLEVLGKKEAN